MTQPSSRQAMTSETFERESRLADNFSKVPHGLWTCDLSHGAKNLLGWLHSHTSSYLATLTLSRIRREFGSGGSIGRWLIELEEAGFLAVVIEKNRHRYRLRAAPWDALATRAMVLTETSQNGTTQNRTTQNGMKTVPKWDENRPEMGPIEDHVEDHLEDQSHASVSDRPAVDFADFWLRYPRKVGKGAAVKRWSRMSADQRANAIRTLPDHAAHWKRQRVETQFIPHPATWLSQGRWDDDLSTEASGPSMPTAVQRAADLYRQAQDSEQRAELGY